MKKPLAGPQAKTMLGFVWAVIAGLLTCSLATHAQTPAQDITCENGSGEYTAQFFTGTTVIVGPIRSGSFAERACAAKLVWKDKEIPVASDVGQVSIDVLGADLGLGKPVVAFQIDKSGAGSRRSYQIYSLLKAPHLLYTITGGDSYSAADTDLDGRIEVWTDDAKAVDGFEGLPGVDFDFVPTVVLRFEKGHLVDVGSEFRSFYDAQIARVRSLLGDHDLAEFKQSDGKPSANTTSSREKLRPLLRTKMHVLEIVWAYLYSGREQEAWSSLEEMWPQRDLERIRAAITAMHARGILHGVEHSRHAPSRGHKVRIYDAMNTSAVVALNPQGGAPDTSQAEPPIIQPKSILLRRPPSSPDGSFPRANEMVELVVDAAGKVRSAVVINGTDKPLIEATAGWQFIPAFREGSPVACRFRLNVRTLR